MSFSLVNIAQVITCLSIVLSGACYIARSSIEYTAYLKDLEVNIKSHDSRIKELERYAAATNRLPQQVKENMNLSAFTKKSLINHLSDDQFKQAIKTVQESTTAHQARMRLQESGLFAKADLNEIFAPEIMKQENAQTTPTNPILPKLP